MKKTLAGFVPTGGFFFLPTFDVNKNQLILADFNLIFPKSQFDFP